MRWHFRDAALLWLFVPAYSIHLAEEWLGAFPVWVAQIAGRPVPGTAFVVINAVAMVVLIAAIHAASRDHRHGWMAVAIATIVLVNTVFHVAGAAVTASYSPGLISAVVVYVPLGSLTMIRALDQAPRPEVARGIVAGMLVHALVFVLAFASTRM